MYEEEYLLKSSAKSFEKCTEKKKRDEALLDARKKLFQIILEVQKRSLSSEKAITSLGKVSREKKKLEGNNTIFDTENKSGSIYNSLFRFEDIICDDGANRIKCEFSIEIPKFEISLINRESVRVVKALRESLKDVLRPGESFLMTLRKLNNDCISYLYDCKWFPYTSWCADIRFLRKIESIIQTSHKGSRRCEKRIDRLIIDHYTPKRLREIKRGWKKLELESYIKKILGEAIEAHIQKKYALSVACLSTMWEGLIRKKINQTERLSQKKMGEYLLLLIDENKLDSRFGEFYNRFIICECNTVDDIVEGVPNRNGVSHSKYKKYPSKKASLNAILITDFFLKLKEKKRSVVSCDTTEK